jgi:hypothetical protein
MSLTSMITIAAESESSGINHWLVGAISLAILLALILGLLAFGAGRDHT